MKSRRLMTLVMASWLLTLFYGRPAWAGIQPQPFRTSLFGVTVAVADQPTTTSVQVPLSGIVFVPLTDGSTDSVALSGWVHVLTHVHPPDSAVPEEANRVRLRIGVPAPRTGGN